MKYLICGLGNPGEKYTHTRHNIGFEVIDELARVKEVTFSTNRYGDTAEISHKGRKLTLLKPSTFMNLSGKAVRYWMQEGKILPENVLIVTDDVNLPTGKLRLRKKGSDGGHNGLRSIIETIQTNEFPRLRFGIGNDYPRGTQAQYVLNPWTEEQRKIITPQIQAATNLILLFTEQGIEKAMNDNWR